MLFYSGGTKMNWVRSGKTTPNTVIRLGKPRHHGPTSLCDSNIKVTEWLQPNGLAGRNASAIETRCTVKNHPRMSTKRPYHICTDLEFVRSLYLRNSFYPCGDRRIRAELVLAADTSQSSSQTQSDLPPFYRGKFTEVLPPVPPAAHNGPPKK